MNGDPLVELDEQAEEIGRLRLTTDERKALQRAITAQEHRAAAMPPRSWTAADINKDCDTLRSLLDRTK